MKKHEASDAHARSTVVFWGAGATAALGMRTTKKQGDFIAALSGVAHRKQTPLSNRVRSAIGAFSDIKWARALSDLLMILGDTDDAHNSIDVIDKTHLDAMRWNWRLGAKDDELRTQIIALRLIYDWPALKDIIRICPGAANGNLQINDLFNLFDLHIPLGHGFRAAQGRFLSTRRLIGAKAALKVVLHAMFYIDWQDCCSNKSQVISHYLSLSTYIAHNTKDKLKDIQDIDRLESSRGKIGFISLNYDPIGLWVQFVANRKFNDAQADDDAALHMFHDMGHFIPSRRIKPVRRPSLWYPMNEASAQRLNEQSPRTGPRIGLIKFLFPHGCLCWRECPDCGKLSAYHGDEWNETSTSLIPPPPLKSFELPGEHLAPDLHPDDIQAREYENEERQRGNVDARACLHCGTITSASHTQTVMQSSMKQAPPSFIDEIQRDLRALIMKADHIILMGYSLPLDDVSYRSLLAARQQRAIDSKDGMVRCSVVGYTNGTTGWMKPSNIEHQGLQDHPTIRAAIDIFGKKNVRFNGEGIPNVFINSGVFSEKKAAELFTWS